MSIIKKLIIIVTTISILIVPTVIEAQIDYQNVINQINDLEEININNIDKVVPKLNEINELYLSLDTESQKLVTNYNVLEDMLNSNASRYDTDKLISNTSSVLSGKNIGFLGSSITYGFSSEGISFVDYIGKIDNCKTIKQAISGGTLAYLPDRPELNPEKSYVKQMIDNLDSDLKLDCLVVQLSTNDAAKGISLGQVSDSKELVDLDYGTIIGAMEYICAYAKEKWNCPVMFYTNSYLDEGYIKNYMNKTNTPDNQFDSIKNTYIDSYQKMITAMYSIQEKWGFTVVDLWNNDKFKNLNYEIKDYMMADIIHPYKAGYLALYTPEIQAGLYNIFSKETNEVVNEETPKIEEKDSVKTGDDKNIIYMLLSLVVTASVIGCLNKRKIYD